jgi:hypothetical protein
MQEKAMLTKMQNNLLISIFGQGIAIGAMTQAVNLPVLIIFAIGLGLMTGGVFREIAKVQSQINRTTSP